MQIIGNYQVVMADNEDDENLSKFIGLLTKFNGGKKLRPDHVQEIEDYFEYYWSHDKMQCLDEDSELNLYEQIPMDTRIQIFKDFLFYGFLKSYNKLFEVPWIRTRKHSYYNWTDPKYSDYMLMLLQKLEPRRYEENLILYEEL